MSEAISFKTLTLEALTENVSYLVIYVPIKTMQYIYENFMMRAQIKIRVAQREKRVPNNYSRSKYKQ